MSLQTIIDRAQQIEIDRKKIVGQTLSRSQRIKTAERSTAQPWRFKITPPGMLKWEQSRGIIEVIDFNDRNNEYEISLGSTPALSYITAYQGSLTGTDLAALSISTTTVNTLVLTNLPSVAATDVMFAQGDLIQPENSRYPYTVVSTCFRGTGTSTTVTLNRSIITSENVNLVGQGVNVGNSCTWRVLITGLPSYQLVPGKNVQYTGDFELIEKII